LKSNSNSESDENSDDLTQEDEILDEKAKKVIQQPARIKESIW